MIPSRQAVWILLSALLVGAVFIVDYIPTNDGPNSILHGYLSLHLHDPAKGYDRFLVSNPNATSRGFNTLFAALLTVMPWKLALRVTLALGGLLWGWGCLALLRAVEPKRVALASFGFATALPWALYMGFYSYWIACGAALWVLAHSLRTSRPDRRHFLVLALSTLIVVVAHAFVGMLLGLVLAIVSFARTGHGARLLGLARLALAGAPAMLVVALSTSGSDSALVPETIRADPLFSARLAPWELVTMPARCFAAGPAWRAAVPPLLGLLGLAMTAVRARRGAAHDAEIGIAAAAATLLISSMAVPFHFEFWKFVSPRFLPFWVMLGIALLPIEQLTSRLAQTATSVASVGFAIASLVWSGSHHLQLAAHESDAIALASAPVRRDGTRLGLKLSEPLGGIAYAEPGLNIPLLYLMEQGGMTPHLFATQGGIHPHVYRAPPSELFPPSPGRFYSRIFRAAGTRPDLPPKAVQLTWLARLGAAYDDVILVSDPEDTQAFVARGYVVDASRGNAAILRYEGCGLDLRVVGLMQNVSLRVEYGWAPTLVPAGERIIEARADAGSAHATFPKAPCGAVWVRVRAPHQSSPTPSYCRGANSLGLVFSTVTPSEKSVTCVASPQEAPLNPQGHP